MSVIDPTKRAAVSWQDWAGPNSSETRFTVAWLDENNREMAQDIRGMHAYWMAQAFKARDAEIQERGNTIASLRTSLAAVTAQLAASERDLRDAGKDLTRAAETEAELTDRLATARKALEAACVFGRYCKRHDFIHGAEADELREKLAKTRNMVVMRVLDKVDARDSLAWREYYATHDGADALSSLDAPLANGSLQDSLKDGTPLPRKGTP